jgi:hypothetical protein
MPSFDITTAGEINLDLYRLPAELQAEREVPQGIPHIGSITSGVTNA